MRIGLLDTPRFSCEELIQELRTHELTILNDEPEVFQKKSNSLLAKNPNQIILWHHPEMAYHMELVDKILEVVRFQGSLTKEERTLRNEQDKSLLPFYLTAVPEDLREKTEEKKAKRLELMKEEVALHVSHWREELSGNAILSDDVIRDVSLDMIKETSHPPVLQLRSNMKLPYSSRYLDWKHIIVHNQAAMRRFCARFASSPVDEVRLTMAHELGHSVDPNLSELVASSNQLWKEMMNTKDERVIHIKSPVYLNLLLEAENNAYDYCYDFLPKRLHSLVEERRIQNENGYKNLVLRKKKSLLHQLQINET